MLYHLSGADEGFRLHEKKRPVTKGPVIRESERAKERERKRKRKRKKERE